MLSNSLKIRKMRSLETPRRSRLLIKLKKKILRRKDQLLSPTRNPRLLRRSPLPRSKLNLRLLLMSSRRATRKSLLPVEKLL
jgi:hypothetical protein